VINHAVASITLTLVAAATPAPAAESVACGAMGGTLSLEGVGAWAVACPER
jgi:hypothetical protein